VNTAIRITSAALEESSEGLIVLRGALDLACLDRLKTPGYQRGHAPLSVIQRLSLGLKLERAPDIELSQRTGAYETEKDHPGAVILPGPVYIIDGLQRVTAAMKVVEEGGTPHIGALIHFDMDEKWERRRFQILNQERTRVSPNVILRNAAADEKTIRILKELTQDNSFSLAGRVSWEQRMTRKTLITALSYCTVVLRLHLRLGGTKANSLAAALDGIKKLGSRVNHLILRANVKAFFGLVDGCWGIKDMVYNERATHLKGTFLFALAEVLADHQNFWRGESLFLTHDWRRKLASFPITDPQVAAYAGSGGRALRELLYPWIVRHLNSGKRIKRLVRVDRLSVSGTRREVK
jgi:hypothetical protein